MSIELARPVCVRCSKPVTIAKCRYAGKRGFRVVDGEVYNWFCGRGCAGADAWDHGNHHHHLLARADANRARAAQMRVAAWADEIAILRRYHIPHDLAVGILARIYNRGRDNAYSKHARRRAA
jgi:hypothetical protein